ncbi:UTRA domain-containing protein [Streptomyces sp. NPDC093060]|uniref:UTRA domain-containing protein n=1 Tax=Streptomyces sp. NPDC093060 TaxID=3366019 RepID=UPI00381802FC
MLRSLEQLPICGAAAAGLTDHTPPCTALAEMCGIRPAEAEETIETSLATPHEAALLHTDAGRPMLLLTRRSRTAEGEPVDRVRSACRGAQCKFVAALTRAAD